MKIRLVFLILLILTFSCNTNESLSDTEKDKIKEKVKEVIDTVYKASEEANIEMITNHWLDSPDFTILFNGRTYSYEEAMAMKPLYNKIKSQKGTLINEKYAVLDNSTVVYTANCKWIVNYKDGSSVLEDPEAFMFLFKKIDNRWRIIYYADSYYEKDIKGSEISQELNQVELHKKFIGFWKCETGKDTTCFWNMKSYGTGFEGDFNYIAKGKTYMEGKQLWGYDKNLDKYIISEIIKGKDNEIFPSWFLSENKCTMINKSTISYPDEEHKRWEVDFESKDKFLFTAIVNNKPVITLIWTRVK
jgi:hypothetical protein